MISAETMLDRFIFMSIGCVIGLVLGWMSRTMRYARQARDDSRVAAERVEQIMKSKEESGKVNINQVALILVVLLVAFSAFASGVASTRVKSNQEDIKQSQACSENILSNVIRTLNERTSYSSEVNRADQAQNEMLLDLARTLSGNPGKDEVVEAVNSYSKKLKKYLNTIKKSQETREDNPYPEVDDYRECLDKEE